MDSSQASKNTSTSSSRLTCPKLKVSRTGSSRANRQAATTKANHLFQPCRRTIGPISQVSRVAEAATLSTMLRVIAAGQSNRAIGSMHSAAKGG